jgi:hypothetical protein
VSWEIHCQACGRSSIDGLPDDESGDRCPICGQLPQLQIILVRDLWHEKACAIFAGDAACSCGAVAEAVKAGYKPDRPL